MRSHTAEANLIQQAREFLTWAQQEGRELGKVWGTVLVALALTVGVTWFLVDLRYRDRLETQAERIALLNDRLGALSPPSPEVGEIDREPPSRPGVPQNARSLTQDQITKLRSEAIGAEKPRDLNIFVAAEGACFDCAGYQNEVIHALSGIRNLKIMEATVMGFGEPHPSGVTLVASNNIESINLRNRLSNGLKAAGIEHGTKKFPVSMPDSDVDIWITTVRKY